MSTTPRLLHAVPVQPSLKRRLSPSLKPDDSWAGELQDLLTCPVCKFDYCHMGSVTQTPTAKGSRLVIPVWSECGHSFDIVLFRHKGQSYVAIENIRWSLEEEWSS